MEKCRGGFGCTGPRPRLLFLLLLLVDLSKSITSHNKMCFPSAQRPHHHEGSGRSKPHLTLSTPFPHSQKMRRDPDDEYGIKTYGRLGCHLFERAVLLLLALIVSHFSFSHLFASPQAICLCSVLFSTLKCLQAVPLLSVCSNYKQLNFPNGLHKHILPQAPYPLYHSTLVSWSQSDTDV